MAASKRFEVWGLVEGEWQQAQAFAKLADADAFCRKARGMEGLEKVRVLDAKGEVAPREYNCRVASAS